MCFLKPDFWTKSLPHKSHLYGFSPVWHLQVGKKVTKSTHRKAVLSAYLMTCASQTDYSNANTCMRLSPSKHGSILWCQIGNRPLPFLKQSTNKVMPSFSKTCCLCLSSLLPKVPNANNNRTSIYHASCISMNWLLILPKMDDQLVTGEEWFVALFAAVCFVRLRHGPRMSPFLVLEQILLRSKSRSALVTHAHLVCCAHVACHVLL